MEGTCRRDVLSLRVYLRYRTLRSVRVTQHCSQVLSILSARDTIIALWASDDGYPHIEGGYGHQHTVGTAPGEWTSIHSPIRLQLFEAAPGVVGRASDT